MSGSHALEDGKGRGRGGGGGSGGRSSTGRHGIIRWLGGLATAPMTTDRTRCYTTGTTTASTSTRVLGHPRHNTVLLLAVVVVAVTGSTRSKRRCRRCGTIFGRTLLILLVVTRGMIDFVWTDSRRRFVFHNGIQGHSSSEWWRYRRRRRRCTTTRTTASGGCDAAARRNDDILINGSGPQLGIGFVVGHDGGGGHVIVRQGRLISIVRVGMDGG